MWLNVIFAARFGGAGVSPAFSWTVNSAQQRRRDAGATINPCLAIYVMISVSHACVLREIGVSVVSGKQLAVI
jgi:hypothetical protein